MSPNCEALLLNRTIAKCHGCRILNVDSHEYQMEGFVYTCVILLFYLLLTTIFMVKIISPRGDARNVDDEAEQKRFIDTRVLKKFREREKRNNREFEIRSRQEVKKQMITYLKHMQIADDSGIGLEPKDIDDRHQPDLPVSLYAPPPPTRIADGDSQCTRHDSPKRFSEDTEIECPADQSEPEYGLKESPTFNNNRDDDLKSELSAEYFV